MPTTRIFGREPAVLLGLIAATLNLLSAYFLHLSETQTTVVNVLIAAIFGFVIAIFTKDSLLAVGLGLAQAAIAVGTAFGFQISPDKQGAIMAFLGIALALFNRASTSPDPVLGLTDSSPEPAVL